MGCVYKIVNKTNGKWYIGLTTKLSPNDRWSSHKWKAKQGERHPLYAAIRKYGIGSFMFDILEEADGVDKLKKLEVHYIAKYNSLVPNGYNISPGGDLTAGGRSPSNVKVWDGLMSPAGKVYNGIKNLSDFARRCELQDKVLRQVARGEKGSYRGWTSVKYKDKYSDEARRHRNGSGMRGKRHTRASNEKRSLSLKQTFAERDPRLERLRACRISEALLKRSRSK